MGAFFAFDENGYFIDKTCFMLISNKAKFLQQILSCKLFEVAYRKIFSSIELGGHGYQYNKHALIKSKHSSFTSSSAPKKILPWLAACAIYLSTSMPIKTRTLLMLSKNGRKEKYPDARRKPTTASRFFI